MSNTSGHNRSNHDAIEAELRGLKDLLGVAQVVVSSLDLDEVLQNILASAMGVMDMPAGSIALYDVVTSSLELHAHYGLSETFVALECWQVKEGGLTHRILDEGGLFVVEDTASASFFNNPLAMAEGIRSLIAVPLKMQNNIIGILYLDDFQPRRFSESRLSLLSILSSFAAMSIDNARLHKQTRRLACTDGLTGLYNHRQFQLMFRDELRRSVRMEKPLSLIMFDIDDFKQFNDRYGHPTGDKVLWMVASALRESLRGYDLTFRYGGEEFIAILPETDLDKALVAAERTRAAIERETARHLTGIATRGVTASVGVATFPRDGDGEELLNVVDQLLYRAKAFGKNRVYHREEGN